MVSALNAVPREWIAKPQVVHKVAGSVTRVLQKVQELVASEVDQEVHFFEVNSCGVTKLKLTLIFVCVITIEIVFLIVSRLWR